MNNGNGNGERERRANVATILYKLGKVVAGHNALYWLLSTMLLFQVAICGFMLYIFLKVQAAAVAMQSFDIGGCVTQLLDLIL